MVNELLPEDNEHRRIIESDISEVVDSYEVQPILFVGSGLSQRYFDAPNWEGLLRKMGEKCPKINKPLEYYKQDNTLPQIGSEFADKYREWAWDLYEEESGADSNDFPDHLYQEDDSSVYLKYKVSEYLKSITPDSLSDVDDEWEKEIERLQEIQPHAIITTNYDPFLERVFPDYDAIIGEEVLDIDFTRIGEIFKIHGCVSDLDEMVLTGDDYTGFRKKKAYLSAKLLTYLSEHPVLIVGYGIGDRNVKSILSDVDRALTHEDGSLIPNIFHLRWNDDLSKPDTPGTSELIPVENNRKVRVRSIQASSYKWPYEAFGESGTIEGMTIKELRKLMGNTYDIVTEEAPRSDIAFQRLTSVSEEENLERLFGITPLEDQPSIETEDGDEADVSAVIDEDGIPVSETLTTQAAESIDESLTAVTKAWNSMNDLLSSRKPIYRYYSQRRELDLLDNNEGRKKAEFLFRSSIQNYSHGVEWLIEYSGDKEEILERTLQEDLDGNCLNTFERVLLVLGKKELLEEIVQSDDIDYMSSRASEFANLCDYSVEDRVNEYVEEEFKFDGETYEVSNLLENPNDVEVLLDDVVGSLLNEDTPTKRAAMRNAELCRLGAEVLDSS